MKEQLRNSLPSHSTSEVLYFGQVIDALNALSSTTPEKIFINIQDYPRHWKIFNQLLSSETELILFSAVPVDVKEENKIQALGLTLVNSIDSVFFPSESIEKKTDTTLVSVAATLVLSNSEELFITEVTNADSTGLTCRDLPRWNQITLLGSLARPTGQVMESLELSLIPSNEKKLLFLRDAEKVLDFLR